MGIVGTCRAIGGDFEGNSFWKEWGYLQHGRSSLPPMCEFCVVGEWGISQALPTGKIQRGKSMTVQPRPLHLFLHSRPVGLGVDMLLTSSRE